MTEWLDERPYAGPFEHFDTSGEVKYSVYKQHGINDRYKPGDFFINEVGDAVGIVKDVKYNYTDMYTEFILIISGFSHWEHRDS